MQQRPIIISPITATDGKLYAIVGMETNPNGILVPLEDVGNFVQGVLTPTSRDISRENKSK